MTATAEELFAARQEAAAEMIAIIRKRRPLNDLEKQLLDCLISEIGVKYHLLPSLNLFSVEAREDTETSRFKNSWF